MVRKIVLAVALVIGSVVVVTHSQTSAAAQTEQAGNAWT